MATTTTLGFTIPSADGSDQISELEEWFRNGFTSVDTYLGSAWTSYTPSTSGLTIGNGSLLGRYKQIGKLVIFASSFTFGTTSAVTATVSLGLPSTAAAATWPGIGQLIDTGTTYFDALINPTTTAGQIFAVNVAGTYASSTALSATVPFTWTNLDAIRLSGFYELP